MNGNKSILFAPVVARSIACSRPQDSQAKTCKDTKNAPRAFFFFSRRRPLLQISHVLFPDALLCFRDVKRIREPSTVYKMKGFRSH